MMLSSKERKRLEILEKGFAMPRWKFILLYGLSFGILLVIITSAIDMTLQHISLTEIIAKRIWLNLVTIPVAGFLFAKILHWARVKEYLALKRKDTTV